MGKQRERLLTIAAIACVGLLFGDKLILTPLQNLWVKRAERIAEVEKLLNKGQFLIDREDAIKKRWNSMRQHSLPMENSVAEDRFLKSLDRWEQKSRLTRTSVKTQWSSQNDSDYETLVWRVTATGDMNSIAQFLYEMEIDPLPLRVEEVECTSQDESGNKILLGVRFSGLRLLEKKS